MTVLKPNQFPEEVLYVGATTLAKMHQCILDAGYGNDDVAALNIAALFDSPLKLYTTYKVVVNDWSV